MSKTDAGHAVQVELRRSQRAHARPADDLYAFVQQPQDLLVGHEPLSEEAVDDDDPVVLAPRLPQEIAPGGRSCATHTTGTPLSSRVTSATRGAQENAAAARFTTSSRSSIKVSCASDFGIVSPGSGGVITGERRMSRFEWR